LEEITPQKISEELNDRAKIVSTVLQTLLERANESEDDKMKRVGLSASVLLHLMSQKMSVYAAKLGVMLIASGKLMLTNSRINFNREHF
jgi:metal-responsive CopG/Arc/MetJ family transcriptional regulator